MCGLDTCGLAGSLACGFGASVWLAGGSGWGVSVLVGAGVSAAAARSGPALGPAWAEAEASSRAEIKSVCA